MLLDIGIEIAETLDRWDQDRDLVAEIGATAGRNCRLLEPFAVSFFPGWPKAASPPGGIYDDDGVFQTLSWSLIVRARWIARARFAR